MLKAKLSPFDVYLLIKIMVIVNNAVYVLIFMCYYVKYSLQPRSEELDIKSL